EGVFIAGDDDRQPEWDTGPASPTPPYGTPRHQPARRLPARRIATTALVLLCITAITFVMFPRNHTIRISPADNPAATASQPTPGVQGGSTPSAAPEAAALTKAAAERILASYWQVNNTANESRSDTFLKTVEAGSSYSMDAGTYQMDRVTDPANRQYTAFTAENATYYIPRQPAGVYPRWFVARVTYANLAAPARDRGRVRAIHPGNHERPVEERPGTLPAAGHRAGSVHRDRRPRLRHRGQRIRRGRAERHVRADPGGDRRIPGRQLHHGQESRQPRRPARRSL